MGFGFLVYQSNTIKLNKPKSLKKCLNIEKEDMKIEIKERRHKRQDSSKVYIFYYI